MFNKYKNLYFTVSASETLLNLGQWVREKIRETGKRLGKILHSNKI